MNKIFLGLGSNVGDKVENILKAIEYFQNDERFLDVACSSLYETKPYGIIEQENFINCAFSFLSEITLDELFVFTKSIEKEIGRIKRQNWGPREIDIDILLFGDEIIKNVKICIPHRDLLNRDFVLIPLLEIDKNLIHPVEKKSLKSFLSKLDDKYIIDKINFNFKQKEISDLTK
ncbi:MAG: 2-amino-4-hydroxy-6-hydroxymethyldihydropteridine diphosphokinase [Ignavibacteriales bacterium]|nr:2-amino-4-hydroxy-6-hydroxymethyldihydropteridine diphosphokinase [Ignavibacteriales bacterium]MCB9209016.1 2-amino-4-hydroxy-6-hydroxymethyldihydropteridine diphosphokinase [Ignavibacteriales bacterium]MCB9218062.1 2-amino-4-hydroxy-6-hydroxymethyldihydropteridine diphosphokinase [Ignavibacteriales bacterium]MCB9260451.1 2-amino-4-hydroxy-6-hydroxymethyldihydropteridine diphosphokinase [Ignavibacteriales bacterium]